MLTKRKKNYIINQNEEHKNDSSQNTEEPKSESVPAVSLKKLASWLRKYNEKHSKRLLREQWLNLWGHMEGCDYVKFYKRFLNFLDGSR
mmetsp:Transcript_27758/g.27634  ORF Transcript_27758/g.27634 Transcript_27758/m.27634 type:complete len:89 (-) Transcript_27758:706-972(-)